MREVPALVVAQTGGYLKATNISKTADGQANQSS
jgi:hypothetical protein